MHNSGRAGAKWLPETMGSGVVFFDADGDGWCDLLFINGRDWRTGSGRSVSALYRNNRKGGFTDVTAGSGLDVVTYGMGAAASITTTTAGRMFMSTCSTATAIHNEGGATFRDVSKAAGIVNASFGTSAAFVDYDRMAGSICSWPTTCSGRRRPTFAARWTARRNRAARPSRIRARPRSCIAISAAGGSTT